MKEFRTFNAMAEYSTRWPGARPSHNQSETQMATVAYVHAVNAAIAAAAADPDRTRRMRQASAVCEEEIFDKIVKMEPSIGPIAGSLGNHCPFCQRNSRLLCVHTVALVRSVLANEPVWRAPQDPRRRHVSWLYNQLKASKILKWLQAEKAEKPEAVA